jgi:transglutaminase-like putative cysteine protease
MLNLPRRRTAALLPARGRICVFAALIAISLSTAHDARQDAAWRLVRERWHTIEINGQRAGHSNELLYDDGARYRLVTEQRISVARGESAPSTVAVSIESIETHAGQPIELTQVRRLGGPPEVTRWVWTSSGEVERVTTEQGVERRVTEPFDTDAAQWLMPHAAEEFERARRAEGASEIEYASIDTSAGLRIIGVRLRRGEPAELSNVQAWTMQRATLDGAPLSETTLHLSTEDGEIVLAEESTGGMHFTVRRATKEAALREITAAPDVLSQTVVRPSARIPRAAATVEAIYRIRSRGGALLVFPSAGAQWAQPNDDGSITLTVDVRAPVPSDEADSANPRYLESSASVNSDDPAIVEFAAEVVERLGDAAATERAKAEALRRAVHRHISRKGLSTAFASASETLRSRSGDCTEHAVLLAALLRAQGIPARVASGLVYAESFAGERNVFAWHMWTQGQIDGAWIDLDATSPGEFSAAHILAGTTDLSNGALGDEITRLVGLMGNLDIEVVSVEHR